jgi:hypothetical protein
VSLSKHLFEATGIKTPTGWLATTSGFSAALAPKFGIIPGALKTLVLTKSPLLTPALLPYAHWTSPFVFCTAGAFLVPAGLHIFFPNYAAGRKTKTTSIYACGHDWSETAMHTNFLITGGIGSGKTSAAVFPIIEQLFYTYCERDNEPTSENKFKAIGGFFLDAKNEFNEGAIFYAYESGRVPAHDVIVVRPNTYLPVVRLYDPKTKKRFYVNATASAGGSDILAMCSKAKLKPYKKVGERFVLEEKDKDNNEIVIPEEQATDQPGVRTKEGSPLDSRVFSFNHRRYKPFDKLLRLYNFEVKKERPFYLGWREEDDGMLYRVKTIATDGTIVWMTDADGKRISIEPPALLQYDGLHYIDSGVQYNVLDPNMPASEVANRAIFAGSLADGEKAGGDNAYFYKTARRTATYAIDLLRNLKPESEGQVTAPDLVNLVSSATEAEKYCKIGKDRLGKLQIEIGKEVEDHVKRQKTLEYDKLKETIHFFDTEWNQMDSKQKTSFLNIISNAFAVFMQDMQLRETFCAPSTFTFEDCVQKGKLVFFVPGPDYETLAKTVAVMLKLDFQSTVLGRTFRSDLDKFRNLLFCNDEAQKHIVAGGAMGNGDENFMSMSRQARCINLIATQSLSSIGNVIGQQETKVYIQSFGGFITFANNDEITRDYISSLSGTKKVEKRSTSGKEMSLTGLLGGGGGGDLTQNISYEDKAVYTGEDIVNLKQWECIAFNRNIQNRHDKWKKTECEPAIIGSPDGKKAVAAAMRRYFREVLEVRAFKEKGGEAFNHASAESVGLVDLPPSDTDDETDPAVETAEMPPASTETSGGPTAGVGSGSPKTASPKAPDPIAVPAKERAVEAGGPAPVRHINSRTLTLDADGIKTLLASYDGIEVEEAEIIPPPPSATVPDKLSNPQPAAVMPPPSPAPDDDLEAMGGEPEPAREIPPAVLPKIFTKLTPGEILEENRHYVQRPIGSRAADEMNHAGAPAVRDHRSILREAAEIEAGRGGSAPADRGVVGDNGRFGGAPQPVASSLPPLFSLADDLPDEEQISPEVAARSRKVAAILMGQPEPDTNEPDPKIVTKVNVPVTDEGLPAQFEREVRELTEGRFFDEI